MGIAPYKYFTFDGESSRNYDVYLTGTGVFNAPQRAVDLLEIPGRNGNYALDQGRFNNITVTYKAGIVDYSESDFADKVSAVRNWLCSKVGYVRLTDDYNPDEYRMAVFKNGITVDHDDLKTGEFEITFECKPQRWLTSGETPIEIGAWHDVQTLSGDIVQLNALETDKVKSLVADIDPVQDLHGYDAPWVGGAGKNKLCTRGTTTTINDVTFTVNADGSIKVKGTASANARFDISHQVDTLVAGTYTLSGGYSNNVYITLLDKNGAFPISGGVIDYGSGKTFTLASDLTQYSCRLMVLSGTAVDTTIYPQIEVGSSPTTWTPYSNICPISGWSGVDVYDDPKHGGIIEWNQLVQNGDFSNGTTGWAGTRATLSASDGVLTATRSSAGFVTIGRSVADVQNHKCYITFDISVSNTSLQLRGSISDTSIGTNAFENNTSLPTANEFYRKEYIYTPTSSGATLLRIGTDMSSINATVSLRNVFIVDLTECFGTGNEPSTVDEFKALFPKDYYAYNAGTETCVSAVNGDTYKKVTVSWSGDAGTVYGGTVDVVSGELTITHAIEDMGNMSWTYQGSYRQGLFFSNSLSGIKINSDLICTALQTETPTNSSSAFTTKAEYSIYKWTGTSAPLRVIAQDMDYTDKDAFKAAMTGVKLCYELATPTTTTLTAQQVDLLLGTNNIFADSGDVTVEYGQNPMVLINPTHFEAEPLLAVKGYGTIDFNGYEVEIENGDLGTIQLASETDITETSVITLNNVAALLNVGDDIYFVVDPSRPGGYAYSAWLKKGDYYSSGTLTSSSNVASTPTISFPSHNPDVGTMSLKPDTSAGFKYGTSSTITATAVFDCTLTDSSTLTLSVSMSYAYDGSNKITVTRTLTASGTYSHISYMKLFCESDSIPEVYGDSTKTLLGNPTYIDCDLGECYKYEGGEIVSLNEKITLGSDLPKLSSGATSFTMDGTITELKVTPRWWKV